MVGSEITDYVVEYNAYPVDDAWTPVDDGGATSSVTIGGRETCATYLFRVRADNATGQGEWIDGKDTPASVPCAPPAPSATNVNGQIALEWAEPPSGSNPVTDYVIEYDAHPVDGVWTTVNDGVNTNTSFIVGGLTLGTRYSFRVTACQAMRAHSCRASTTAACLVAMSLRVAQALCVWFQGWPAHNDLWYRD